MDLTPKEEECVPKECEEGDEDCEPVTCDEEEGEEGEEPAAADGRKRFVKHREGEEGEEGEEEEPCVCPEPTCEPDDEDCEEPQSRPKGV